eukprot:scaffold19612_cov56-Phaeocystis_antarctica.AAC.1
MVKLGASVSPARREARWAPPLHANIVTVRKLSSIAGGVCPSCGPPACESILRGLWHTRGRVAMLRVV